MTGSHPDDPVLQFLRKIAGSARVGALSDADLLCAFVSRGEQAAFAAIVCRHGPMVWRLCLRILGNEQDAEDAFQASFVVLVRKATSLRPKETLGGWLYSVAYRISHKARLAAARRRKHEGLTPARRPADPLAELTLREAHETLDQELVRLPDKFRVPLVLCYLEGLTAAEAAQRLGWSPSTLKSRLEQARARLRSRLGARGLTLSGALVAALFGEGAAAAAVPPVLLDSVVKAGTVIIAGGAPSSVVSTEAAALAKGALKAMLLSKVKTTAAALALLAALACLGVGAAMHSATAADDPAKAAKPQPAGKAEEHAKAAEIRVLVEVEEVNVKDKHGFITGTMRITQPPGGDLVHSKLVDVPVKEDAKIRIGGKDAQLSDMKAAMSAALQLVVEEGGLVVVGIEVKGKD